jgi:hypothetical protein
MDGMRTIDRPDRFALDGLALDGIALDGEE